MQHADHAQSLIDSGDAGPLTGVPIALKDNLSTEGIPTTCASKILEGYIPPYDAHVVEIIKQQGMPIIGKTNLDEFAMGTSNENSAYGPVRNPIDPERVPGGSSGGSAAAVAGGITTLSLGSDTGGSVRQPAALCGVVGFKPTYGRISRFGLIAFASSLDQIGPFGHSVEDVALAASVLSDHDDRDSTNHPDSKIRIDDLKGGTVSGKKFGLPAQMLADSIEASVRAQIEKAVHLLQKDGATVDIVDVPAIPLGVTTYYIIAPCEASSNLARYDGIRYGPSIEGATYEESIMKTRGSLFGHEVRLRIIMGTYALSSGYYDAYYLKAQRVRAMMTRELNEVFKDYDAVLGPTCPVTAFKLGEKLKDPMALKVLDYCTIPANLGGFPSISIPCGNADGLPVGLCLTGMSMHDESLLQLSYAVESTLEELRSPAASH